MCDLAIALIIVDHLIFFFEHSYGLHEPFLGRRAEFVFILTLADHCEIFIWRLIGFKTLSTSYVFPCTAWWNVRICFNQDDAPCLSRAACEYLGFGFPAMILAEFLRVIDEFPVLICAPVFAPSINRLVRIEVEGNIWI